MLLMAFERCNLMAKGREERGRLEWMRRESLRVREKVQEKSVRVE